MAVSANTLFHFTSKSSLGKILKSEVFLTKYSLERFNNFLPKESAFKKSYIPMLCFCDLTITQLAKDSLHTKHYGEYGIGLTKTWGIKNGMSPVIYVHKKSQPSKQLDELIDYFKNKLDKTESENMGFVREKLIDSFKYIKPYQGKWHKEKRRKKDIIYYNEREWRFVPSTKDFTVFPYSRKVKNKISKKNTELKKTEKYHLKFSAKNIKYIIIRTKGEIEYFVEKVIKKMKIDKADQDELITKIITWQEIKDDF